MHEFYLSAHITIVFILIAISTEAFIEIVKGSDISLLLIHSKIIPRYESNATWYNYTLYKWITCGQCMSVIYSIPGAMFLSTYYTYNYLPFSFIVFLFAIQRVTNWLNTLYKLLHRGRVTAIELISPLVKIGPNMEDYNPEVLLSGAREREFRRGTEERVYVNNLNDIKRIIKLLKEKKPGTGRVVSLNIGENQFNINTSTDHPPYMEIIKDAFIGSDANNAPPPIVEINNGEQLVPLTIGSNHIIDNFIRNCAGGVREGNRIKWSLPNEFYYYDPISGSLTMSNKNNE